MYGYRLLVNADGTVYALAEMDPDRLNVAQGHRNVWVEAPVEQKADWLMLFGPAQVVSNRAVWNSFSNDPNRIPNFPPENPPAIGAITDAQVAALAGEISAKLPTGITPAQVQAAVTAALGTLTLKTVEAS